MILVLCQIFTLNQISRKAKFWYNLSRVKHKKNKLKRAEKLKRFWRLLKNIKYYKQVLNIFFLEGVRVRINESSLSQKDLYNNI